MWRLFDDVNREAVACDSLGRKSQVLGDNGTMSREAAADVDPRFSIARPAVASRLHLRVSLFLGLASQAITCRRFATDTSFRVSHGIQLHDGTLLFFLEESATVFDIDVVPRQFVGQFVRFVQLPLDVDAHVV